MLLIFFQLQKIMEMTTRNVRQQSSKNPKPFVYVGPGFPTLFYPRGPKKIRKFPGFVVHKSSLKPHAYLFPSLSGKPAREHQDEVNPNLKKQENNNEGSSEVNSTVSSGQVQVLQILEKVETVESVESVSQTPLSAWIPSYKRPHAWPGSGHREAAKYQQVSQSPPHVTL